ncbi:acyltransferase [Yoonia sp.]|uniref:acyltransferase family protein n=1 Tax=Yoonia sp. TaxID=2212373 RepID=UPI001A01EBBA|nr:acyltransferase [Yoonia sp.]MBE0414738.1 acyltransferase [Yoonia sp.]
MTPAPITHDRYLATRHFGSLDGLRFICIAAVIWHHAPNRAAMSDIAVFFSRGHVGVDFFFVLSGFLITTLLLREETAKGAFSLRAFYWRRILRIIPIYFLVVSIAAFYALVIKGYDQLAILPYYYLFLSNFLVGEDIGFLSITWSLAVEEQYYMLWPALLLLTPRRWIVTVLVVLIAINVLAALEVFRLIGIYPIDIAHLRLQITAATYAPILMGSLAAILLHRPAGFAALRPLTTFRGAALVWFIALLVALAAFPGALEGLPNLVVHSLMTLMLISLVIREDNAMAPVMQLRPIARVGQVSYGIYLYHLFALAIVNKALEILGIPGTGWVLPLYFALAIVISEISFRTYEAWFMQFRHNGPGRVNPHPPKPAE